MTWKMEDILSPNDIGELCEYIRENRIKTFEYNQNIDFYIINTFLKEVEIGVDLLNIEKNTDKYREKIYYFQSPIKDNNNSFANYFKILEYILKIKLKDEKGWHKSFQEIKKEIEKLFEEKIKKIKDLEKSDKNLVDYLEKRLDILLERLEIGMHSGSEEFLKIEKYEEKILEEINNLKVENLLEGIKKLEEKFKNYAYNLRNLEKKDLIVFKEKCEKYLEEKEDENLIISKLSLKIKNAIKYKKTED